jgi:hypothetical protein
MQTKQSRKDFSDSEKQCEAHSLAERLHTANISGLTKITTGAKYREYCAAENIK